ncbi:T9SS type A sorting domain-containing protein [Winogradskyella sp. SYSU M77433]|uniref:T9SS type A sorting domain-containing protein n=1 Tax=Winogradskyella sp. SYSU M77433 TaxID=3042722 RepID=UPI0024805E2D|nr:T9SS type A sorting domain-containing protein [Winogradskyella sp. SYSU M77433]MDH7914177.1 T9SS type A sorting domain-containing protein [Winogradskyella sp. SYSU M77433]|tara:strand:- start:25 stop:333 length:309 start_codon:yes stop_codon:yes gene_type:complete
MRIKLLFLLFFVSAFSFAQLNVDQKDEFTISPNPAKNKLNITLPSTDNDIKLEVFDVLGKRVYKGVLTRLESSINVSDWKNGVYLVRVTNDKVTQTKRFIKQ